MSLLKLAHILVPVTSSLLFTYFTLLLNEILWSSILILSCFLCLFVLYGLTTFSLFNHHPGYETYYSSKLGDGGMSVDRIGECKENERKIYELMILMREDIEFQKLQVLQKQYLVRYQKPSFCNICELIKSPRTQHCEVCNRCVLRQQKHTFLLDMCIGAKNIKLFIKYMFIAMIVVVYMGVVLVTLAVLRQDIVENFNQPNLCGFAVFLVFLGAAGILFSKEFSISYFNTLDNITETQRKLDIITKKNNPFKNEAFYEKLFHSKLEFIKINQIADPNNWLEFNEEEELQNQKN